ncbi:MAG: DUF4230 domain-containing protein [Phycisphaerales bacterium]|nr:DUF4230 domain-containing protein [Phycisphaerales bacterium]
MNDLILLIIALSLAAIVGAGVVFYLLSALKRARAGKDIEKISLKIITERVRAVGKLVGLEVHAKEIATATAGYSWLPPILLSQAKIAMIFQFEKQYAIELGGITESDVTDLGDAHFRITLPPIVGSLRLMDVEPYDIQQGRVLGLIDVINMNAHRQNELMRTAQDQAAELFEKNDDRYINQARETIERQLNSIAKLFDITLEIEWSAEKMIEQPRIQLDESLKTGPAVSAK